VILLNRKWLWSFFKSY